MEYSTAVKKEWVKTTLINMDESHKVLKEKRKGKRRKEQVSGGAIWENCVYILKHATQSHLLFRDIDM